MVKIQNSKKIVSVIWNWSLEFICYSVLIKIDNSLNYKKDAI